MIVPLTALLPCALVNEIWSITSAWAAEGAINADRQTSESNVVKLILLLIGFYFFELILIVCVIFHNVGSI